MDNIFRMKICDHQFVDTRGDKEASIKKLVAKQIQGAISMIQHQHPEYRKLNFSSFKKRLTGLLSRKEFRKKLLELELRKSH